MSKSITIPEELYRSLEIEARQREISIEQAFEEWVQQFLKREQERTTTETTQNQNLGQQAEDPVSSQ